jgi:hypothetical protein
LKAGGWHALAACIVLAGTAISGANAQDAGVAAAGQAAPKASAAQCNEGKDPSGKACALPGKLYPPAAQLKSWDMRVFATRDITLADAPKLELRFGHAVLQDPADRAAAHGAAPASGGGCALDVADVARNQVYVGGARVDGQDAQHVGTWLLFSLKRLGKPQDACAMEWWKPVSRAQPVLTWGDQATCADCKLAPPLFVHVGSAVAAIAYSIAVLLLFIAAVWGLLRWFGCDVVGFFLVRGRLSLSMVQMALWTCTVGFVVLYELFVALEAASIPESLIVLMGASLLTAGASSLIGRPLDGTAAVAAQDTGPRPIRQRIIELFTTEDQAADGTNLSFARLQMLFWTVMIIIMFIGKSLLQGALWEVPWTLVALMGISQAGYVAGKFGTQPPAEPRR